MQLWGPSAFVRISIGLNTVKNQRVTAASDPATGRNLQLRVENRAKHDRIFCNVIGFIKSFYYKNLEMVKVRQVSI